MLRSIHAEQVDDDESNFVNVRKWKGLYKLLHQIAAKQNRKTLTSTVQMFHLDVFKEAFPYLDFSSLEPTMLE